MKNTINQERIQNEIEHGKHLKELMKHGEARIWEFQTPAGRHRWERRVNLLTSHLKPGMQVLEIGCGTGIFTKEIAKHKVNLIAIDISPELLDDARINVPSNNVQFQIENAYELSFADNSFDSIIASSVLHHLEIENAIKEFYRVLKPGGTAIFSEPNMMNPQIAIQKNVPFIKRWLEDSPDETAFLRWSIVKVFKNNGFKNVSALPYDFMHPFIPKFIIKIFKPIIDKLDQIPVVKEIAGSLLIRAEK